MYDQLILHLIYINYIAVNNILYINIEDLREIEVVIIFIHIISKMGMLHTTLVIK